MANATTSGESLYQTTERRSRYGRKDWVFWKDRSGKGHAAPVSAETVKQALLAVGTKGRFVIFYRGMAHRISWRLGLLAMRNARVLSR